MSRRILLLAAAGLAVALVIGFALGRFTSPAPAPGEPPAESGRKVLYWYDPMRPEQRFDRPGKSPFMDMDLVPKYADEAEGQAGVRIDPARTQSLGVRLATVERGALPGGVTAAGTVAFNERDVAIVQAKASGFVQRVYGRAPGDVVAAGAPLADLLVPEWAGAQGEFLAVLRAGDPALAGAARQRLQLLGMPPSLIAQVERSGQVRNVVTVSTPTGGAIRTLGVRNGMTVAAGQTLAEVNGLGTVWLNAAVPEAQAGEVRLGQAATASLAAWPGEAFRGRVTAILPETETASRTLTVRVELANPSGRLRPGMFATVELGGVERPALLIPSEAVIRTGRRSLVMVARDGGRYAPVEVRTGREAAGRIEVLSGLTEGQRVVASGQFLIDSEASLAGVRPVPAPGAKAGAPPAAALHEGVGRVEQVTPRTVTLSHEAIPALQWPAMTMTFALAAPEVGRGVKAGDRVRFAFEQTRQGPVVRRMTGTGGR